MSDTYPAGRVFVAGQRGLVGSAIIRRQETLPGGTILAACAIGSTCATRPPSTTSSRRTGRSTSISWAGDPGKPDGMPRKLLDVSRLHELGWRHRIALRAGITSTYEWFITNATHVRGLAVTTSA